MDYTYITSSTTTVEFKKRAPLGVDIETDGLNFRTNNILTIQISDGENTYIFDARLLPDKYFVNLFQRIDAGQHLQIYHNGKFDLKFIYEKYGYMPLKAFDTMLAEALTVVGKRSAFISLREIVQQYLGRTLDKEVQVSFTAPLLSFSPRQLEYAALDAYVLTQMYPLQKEKLAQMGLTLTAALEFALLPVVAKMEVQGVSFNIQGLLPLLQEYELEANRQEQILYKIMSQEFNPRSPQQVKKMFHLLGIELESTARKVLVRVKHPLARAILDYRSAYTIISRYGPNLIEKVESDGKIHAEFNQLGAASGRFSSTNPNLQNIPATKSFRSLFVASPGYTFVTSDFSQIELRIAGVLSGEEEILKEYRKSNADMHTLTASKIFMKTMDEVTPLERPHGKTGNFAVLYGIYYRNLARNLQMTEKLAKQIVNGFWEGYPALKSYMAIEGNYAVENGFNRTEIGRLRWYNLPMATDPLFRSKCWRIKRSAANNKLQGFAADIMKSALICVDHALRKKNIGYIVLTVHDEIGMEIKDEHIDEGVFLIKQAMETAAHTMVHKSIPMPVSVKIGKSWIK